MKVLYYRVVLEKNEHFSTPVWIYPWELPVFSAVHRKSALTELDKRAFNKRFAPEAAVEYSRLENKYKGPEGSDVSYAATVYGHGSTGVKKLHEAMVEAAKETEAFLIAERDNPTPAVKVDAAEFASPFAGEELPEGTEGIETQADLRKFVGGDAATVEAVTS